mgnify:CR=1 FL=1
MEIPIQTNLYRTLIEWLTTVNSMEGLYTNLAISSTIKKLYIEINNELTQINDFNDIDKWFEKYNINDEDKDQILHTYFRLEIDETVKINGKDKLIRVAIL